MHMLFANLADHTAVATLAQLVVWQSALGSVATILVYLLTILNLLIFLRAILSWFMPVGRDPLTKLLVDLTDPVLIPVRQLVSRFMPMQGIDFSPMIVLLLIQFVFIPLVASLR
jgi:YggT family protein